MKRNSTQIRIISGQFGGQFIDTPKTAQTHPMGERERMAIFNALRDEIPGPKAIRTIKQNLAKFNQTDSAILRAPDGDYSIIFADPPYDDPQYNVVAELIYHLVPGGFFVLSHPETPEPPAFPYLELLSDKKYAAAHIKIYRKK